MSKDLFSIQADAYARYRPSYPPALIDYLLSFTKARQRAWDCATGNGQAAVLLAPYFETIIATDTSEKQLSLAVPESNIVYQAAKAEQTGFPDNQFDLITVAQAYHWFTFAAFEKEAKRVAKPGCIIAAWCYNIPATHFEPLNGLIKSFYTTTVGPYWDAERKFIDDCYQTIPFNFEELPSKQFSIDVLWTEEALSGYFNSWSSVQHFITANKYNPVDALRARLSSAWPSGTKAMPFSFPIFLRIGRIDKN